MVLITGASTVEHLIYLDYVRVAPVAFEFVARAVKAQHEAISAIRGHDKWLVPEDLGDGMRINIARPAILMERRGSGKSQMSPILFWKGWKLEVEVCCLSSRRSDARLVVTQRERGTHDPSGRAGPWLLGWLKT